MDIFWELSTPGPQGSLADSYFHTGIVTALTDKYAHWCAGGNGGIVRQPTGRLYDYQKDAIRAGLKSLGHYPARTGRGVLCGPRKLCKGIQA